MSFNDWAFLMLVILGGAVLLIGLIVAGSVTLSFMTRAQPVPEAEERDAEAPAAAVSI
jgi:hypothetical protein